ncbi:MAG: hypothetical protein IJH40_09090 [Ruminococcus sp.]|uniref:hypothetical protein n=1 Tax=Ruminococcus sp. TaxID=41978 RepID=UPI002873CA48|nr:hypothetical protein [Ruminococcus sp.]MBQ3285778.1 hypothetical protein [Ruminococcus sp.]
MPDGVKKGITVKVDAALHAEVTEYIREHGMTMSEFVAIALDNELHPKYDQKEGNNMANTRTVAFQVPEELFQRIKDYLNRNHMTQKQFLLGLIEQELDREQTACESQNADFEDEGEQDEDDPDLDEDDATEDFEDDSDEDEFDEESEDDSEDESEDDEEEFDPADFDDEDLDDDDLDEDEDEDEGYSMSM